MMRILANVVALAAAVAAVGAATHARADAPIACLDARVCAPGWRDDERAEVCAAADRAIVFLRDAGVSCPMTLTIRPVEQARAPGREHLLGYFDRRSGEVSVVTYERARAAAAIGPAPLGVPMTRGMWASLVSHEVAHAIAEPHFAPGVEAFAATEYIAAVVQLSTMPAADRQAVLAAHADVEAYGDPEEISSLLYLMNPAVFAVKCYRHYVELGEHGAGFVRVLLREGLRN